MLVLSVSSVPKMHFTIPIVNALYYVFQNIIWPALLSKPWDIIYFFIEQRKQMYLNSDKHILAKIIDI